MTIESLAESFREVKAKAGQAGPEEKKLSPGVPLEELPHTNWRRLKSFRDIFPGPNCSRELSVSILRFALTTEGRCGS
jgi:hypothetical protein